MSAANHAYAFYSQAWDTLLSATVAIIGLVGVLIPLVLSYLNSRNLKAENEALTSELRAYLDQQVEQVQRQVEQGLEKKSAIPC